MRSNGSMHGRWARTGFTLVELMVAGVVAAAILGSVAMSLSQIGRARNTSKMRFDAHLRADAALNAIRQDIASVIRSDDLFFTRLLLRNDGVRVENEEFARDEILLFNIRLKPLRNIDFNGEGFEYETHYRVTGDELGSVLWQRRDAVPDEYPEGGGIVTPLVDGVLGLAIEAYDGFGWYEEWDSDIHGLPLAVRVTVLAAGNRGPDDLLSAPRATLRTVIPIDRVLPPKDLFKTAEDEAADAAAPQDQAAEQAGEDENPPDTSGVPRGRGRRGGRGGDDQNGDRPRGRGGRGGDGQGGGPRGGGQGPGGGNRGGGPGS